MKYLNVAIHPTAEDSGSSRNRCNKVFTIGKSPAKNKYTLLKVIGKDWLVATKI